MVALSKVLARNESLKQLHNLTAVFVGATQGIGLGSLRAFVRHTTTPTAYFVGRSRDTLDRISSELKTINPGGNYIPIECADLTLLRNVDFACKSILEKTTSTNNNIDLLCLSAGFMSFSGRKETSEGLDAQMSITYYSRARFIQNLLPLLRHASSPHVVTVLSGGKEGELYADDLPLKQHYGTAAVAGATAAMNTLFLDELATYSDNSNVTFVHLLPGFVGDTNIWNKSEHLSGPLRFLLGKIVTPAVSAFIGISSEECGERVLYAGTAKMKGLEEVEVVKADKNIDQGGGGKTYLFHSDSTIVDGSAVLSKMRSVGMAKKVWEHTMSEFERITAYIGRPVDK